MKKALVFLLLTFILISFAAQSEEGESNATRAIVLYNRAISQMAMGDYTDAFKNLKEARELLPTITSVVNGFQQIYDNVKYHYTKQMIMINKLGVATQTTVKKTEEKKSTPQKTKPIFIYGLLGFLLFFTATYSLLYFVEIKNSMISGFFVSGVIALASKYGYTPKVSPDLELDEDEDSDEIIEIEEVSQEEADKIEKKIAPEDVEDENVEEILSQLLGINEEGSPTDDEIEEEREEEEELSQDENIEKSGEKGEEKSEQQSEDQKELSAESESVEKTYALKIDEIKDPRNDMLLTIERLKGELHQIVSVLREKEIKNQDELDNALKIMYVYATTSENDTDNVQIKEEGGNDDAE